MLACADTGSEDPPWRAPVLLMFLFTGCSIFNYLQNLFCSVIVQLVIDHVSHALNDNDVEAHEIKVEERSFWSEYNRIEECVWTLGFFAC